MKIINPPFKSPPKKYQPHGLTIIYEDKDIIVVNKSNGLLSMGTDREKEKTAYFLLSSYVKKGNSRSKARVFIVHRLDKDTSGILVFAKDEKSKRYLQDNWKDFSKRYFAVVQGKLDEKEGLLSSYLNENKTYHVYAVKDPEDGKFSQTAYKIIKESEKYSLAEITLLSGRKNQIRVQFADEDHPVVGDKVYGSDNQGIKRLCLHAGILTIKHPFSKKEMTFMAEIPQYFNTLLK